MAIRRIQTNCSTGGSGEWLGALASYLKKYNLEDKVKTDEESAYVLMDEDKQMVITPDGETTGTYSVEVKTDEGVTTESGGNYTDLTQLLDLLGVEPETKEEESEETETETTEEKTETEVTKDGKKILRAGDNYKASILKKQEDATEESEDEDDDWDKHETESEAWEDVTFEEDTDSSRNVDALNCSCAGIKRKKVVRRKPVNASRKPVNRRPFKDISINASAQPLQRRPQAKLNSCAGECEKDECNLAETLLKYTPEVQKVPGCLFNLQDSITGQPRLYVAYVDTVDNHVVATPVDTWDHGFDASTVEELCATIFKPQAPIETTEVEILPEAPMALPGDVAEFTEVI